MGGFFGNVDTELLVRWNQVATFYPFFRGHAHLEAKRREPWLFGEDATRQNRAAIRARYALLPYLYTLFWEAHTSGGSMELASVSEGQPCLTVMGLAAGLLHSRLLCRVHTHLHAGRAALLLLCKPSARCTACSQHDGVRVCSGWAPWAASHHTNCLCSQGPCMCGAQ